MATVDVPIAVNTRWSTLWVRMMSILRYLVGAERAGRWAVWGAYRFARFQAGVRR